MQWINERAENVTSSPAPTGTVQSPNAPAQSPNRGSWVKLGLGAGAGVVVAALLVMVLVVTGVFSVGSGGSQAQGPSYSSPEDAAKAFLEGLRDRDMDAMTGTFAVRSYVENCDNAAYLKRISVYSPATLFSSCPFPAEDSFGAASGEELRRAQVTESIVFTLTTWVSPHLSIDEGTVQFDDDSAVEDFEDQTAKDFSNYLFAGIENIESVSPGSLHEAYDSDVNEKSIAAQAATYGLEEEDFADVALTFDVDGESWVFVSSVARYDGRWYLLYQGGILSALLGISNYAGGISPESELDSAGGGE